MKFVFLLVAGLSMVACRPSASAFEAQDDGFVFRPPAAIPGSYLLRQRVTVRVHGHEGAFDAVLQKTPTEILLVGLTPFGTRAFAARQTGGVVRVETFVDRELPFSPKHMLVDVQRALFKGAPGGDATGARQGLVDGEAVSETWRQGRLVERVVRRPGVDGEFRVRFEPPGDAAATEPFVMQVTNTWAGYELAIETTEVVPLALSTLRTSR